MPKKNSSNTAKAALLIGVAAFFLSILNLAINLLNL
jgi:hypothetical protein